MSAGTGTESKYMFFFGEEIMGTMMKGLKKPLYKIDNLKPSK